MTIDINLLKDRFKTGLLTETKIKRLYKLKIINKTEYNKIVPKKDRTI